MWRSEWPGGGELHRDPPPSPEHDDTLALMFMSCHPELTPASAIALTLGAVAGLATAEIAAAFLVPEATMAQRISRAKRTIKASGIAHPLLCLLDCRRGLTASGC